MYTKSQFNNSDNPISVAFHEIDREIARSIRGLFSLLFKSTRNTVDGVSEGSQDQRTGLRKLLKHR